MSASRQSLEAARAAASRSALAWAQSAALQSCPVMRAHDERQALEAARRFDLLKVSTAPEDQR